MTRIERLAEAYELVAKANHYMVGVIEPTTVDEKDAAEQILITRQNASWQGGTTFKQLELALDVLEHDRKTQRGF